MPVSFLSRRRFLELGGVLGAVTALLSGGSQSPSSKDMTFLKVDGIKIVDGTSRPVRLKGVNLGGWQVYERWLFDVWDEAWPADEHGFWCLMRDRFGPGKTRYLRQAYRYSFINEEDFRRIKALGFNCVRLPFSYLDLEPEPGRYDGAAFEELDRAIKMAARYRLYTILDLHGAPGGQSGDHHTGWQGRNYLWKDGRSQERTVALWKKLARRYRKLPEVAGYDLLNEPMGAPSIKEIVELSDRIYRAIRRYDKRHIVFIEEGFKGLESMPEPETKGWQNVVYSIHYYPFGRRTKEAQEEFFGMFDKVRQEQLRLKVPLFIGEFSAVEMACGGFETYDLFLRKHDEYDWSWCMWTWKRFVQKRSDCIWGVLNQPKTGAWKVFDPGKDSFEDLEAAFMSLDSINWTLSRGMRKLLSDHLKKGGDGD